jgi:cellobiose phosphorylase
MTLFIIRHYLGVRFEGDQLVIQPALYPDSPPVIADLRIRNGRLRLNIEGSGSIKKAFVNGKTMMPGADGAIRLGPDSMSGTVVIKTN